LPAHGVCGRCLRSPPAFAHTVAAFRYAFPLDRMIRALKFDECLIIADFLADALAARVEEKPDLLIPLPLHPARLRERGFNQSHLLATRLARTLRIPLLAHAATRVRDTLPQSSLPWRKRGKNMKHAFALATGTDVRGMHVAIVDDVMTTGATMDALARVLRQGGAEKVSAWVVARTFPGRAS
jgi:ComF family protein